jgi:hypothetical protein
LGIDVVAAGAAGAFYRSERGEEFLFAGIAESVLVEACSCKPICSATRNGLVSILI